MQRSLTTNTLFEKSLYLFIFSIPFSEWDLGIGWSISALLSIPFFLLSIEYWPVLFSVRHIKTILFPLLAWLFCSMFSNYAYNGGIDLSFTLTFLQCIVMCWMFINLFAREPRIRNTALNVFLSAFSCMCVLALLGIGSQYISGRLFFFGTNPNSFGLFGVFSLTIILDRLINRTCKKSEKYLYYLQIVLFLVIIAQTGSRGAVVGIILSVLTLILFRNSSLNRKFRLFCMYGLGLVCMLSLMFFVSDTLAERMNSLLQSGDDSRTEVWEAALPIYKEHKILGVGITGYREEITQLLGYFKDTHNAYLYILVTTGIVGSLFFGLFLWNALKRSYKSRHASNLAMTFFILILFTWSKGGGTLYVKLMWFYMSIALSYYFPGQGADENQ